MELSNTLENYLEELSSNSPTPGGGNVSALCGVLASSLGTMVCNLTIGKKKYADVENELTVIKNKLGLIKENFRKLAKKDNEAFDKVMLAFKMPKETEEQKLDRAKAIESATIDAAMVPAEVVSAGKEILPLLETIVAKGNQNSLSDAGVAVSLTKTAVEGAFLNIAINCSSLSNQTIANEILIREEMKYHEVKEKAEFIIASIIKKMRVN
ncbi:MAG: cyclodeaminase/cyclohydrolase family protein [Ignavibacteriaceae bacterium]|jgi:formiminotetrahydrofolate cyclodeaminase